MTINGREIVRDGGGRRLKLMLLSGTIPAVFSFVAPAVAQPAEVPAATREDPEIVVTAQRREQRLQDVSLSMAVLSGNNLERRGLSTAADILRTIPGVNQVERGPVDNAVIIRGISTSPQSENFSSGTTVATFFGEVPITGSGGIAGGTIDARAVDLARVEVLRGPQGTAFGSSSLGGTVRLIPAQPDPSALSASLRASVSDTARLGSDGNRVEAVINVPLVDDRVAVRIVGYRHDDTGFYRNIAGLYAPTVAIGVNNGLGPYVAGFTQDDVGRTRTLGVRASVLVRLSDRFDVTGLYLRQRTETDGRPEADLPGYQQARIPITPQGRVRSQLGETVDTNIDLYNLTANYHAGIGTFTSSVSWVNSGSLYTTDLSTILPARFPVSAYTPSDFSSFTAEGRFASSFSGPFQFLAGVYYEDIDQEYFDLYNWPGAPAPSPVYITNPVGKSQRIRALQQTAVFGEISYEVLSNLTATVGGRYFDYEKSERIIRTGGLNGLQNGAVSDRFFASADDGTTFRANLTYRFDRNAMIYATWSQGFRLGRTDPGANPATCDQNNDGIIDGSNRTIESTRDIASDSIDNYEVGTRLTLFGGDLHVDASAYHLKWDRVPVRTVTGICAFTANAGSAEVDGLEFQTAYRPSRDFHLDFGFGYTNARLSEDAPGLLPPGRKGDRLPGSPRWSANLGAQYDFPLFGRRSFIRTDMNYVGPFYGDLRQSALTRAGDYVRIDGRAGIALDDFSIELFVRNLTNQDAYTWRGLTNANASFGFLMQPRTVGVQLGYAFR